MKKVISTILVLCMVLACVSAYAAVNDHTDYSQFPLVAEGENVKITAGAVLYSAYPYEAEETWFWKWSEAATGIDFDVTQLTDTSLNQQKVLKFAGDDLPEIMLSWGFTTSELVRYGTQEHQLKDLAPYINADTMPYLTKWFDAYPNAKALCTTPDGAIYSLPLFSNLKVPVGTQETLNINQAWLTEMGEEIPTTLDGFTALMYKIKEAYPESTPISGAAISGDLTYNPLSYLLNAFGYITDAANDFGNLVALRNGEVVIPCGDPTFKEFLKLCNQYYKDGILQNNFFTADSLAVNALMMENKTALYPTAAYLALPAEEDFQKWVAVKPLTSEWNDKQQWKDVLGVKIGGAAVANYTSDEHVKLILRYLDFFYSELGSCYLLCGPIYGSADTLGLVDGFGYVDGAKYFYDFQAGKYESALQYGYAIGTPRNSFGNRSHSIDYSDKQTYFLEMLQYVQGVPMDEIEPYEWNPKNGDGWNRLNMKANVAPHYVDGFPDIVYYDDATQETIDEIVLMLNAHVESEVAKFITGARDIEEFDTFVSECEALGLRNLEEIYKTAYASYVSNK